MNPTQLSKQNLYSKAEAVAVEIIVQDQTTQRLKNEIATETVEIETEDSHEDTRRCGCFSKCTQRDTLTRSTQKIDHNSFYSK